jgi:Tfp pilus assembly protein PilZ
MWHKLTRRIAMMGNERFEVRKAYGGPVDLIAGLWDQAVTYLSEDLSPRGTFLRTSFPLSLGETVVCSFSIPGARRELELFGKVVRVEMPRRRADRGRTGMGIRFLGVSAKDRLLIRSSLRGTPPPLPAHVRKAA